MDSNNTSLIEELVELKVQERINQALVDTILDNTTLNIYDDKPFLSDKGIRELYTLIERFYSDEFEYCIDEIKRKDKEDS